MEEKEIETWYNLVNLNWSKKKVVGIVDKDLASFCPITYDLFEKLVKESARPGPFLENDPSYKAMKEYMKTQQKEAEKIASDLARMSGDERKKFIKEHVEVIVTPDNDHLKDTVWNWLVELCNTPEGRKNIALAMGSAEGGDDGKFSIRLGTKEDLMGAGATGDSHGSMITLSKESVNSQGDGNKKNVLPHEICHLGQEFVENLSDREMALYYGLLLEAQARLVEYCDGVTEGRNDKFEGFLHSLKDDLEVVVKDLKKSGVLKENMTPEDFIKLKDTNRPQYDLIMGRIKEKQFSGVLNNLGKNPLYQRQGMVVCLWPVSGPGNLPALKAWVDVVCERTGMRKDVIWPEVCAMATGAKEIPGYENCFTKEGKISEISKQKHAFAQKLIDLGFGSSIISSCVLEGNEIKIECENGDKGVCSFENGQLKEKNWTYANGNKSVESYENGQLKEENWTYVNGNKFVRSYENGQIKEENLTYGNGDKSVCSYENGQRKEINWTCANGDKGVCSYENGQLKEENWTYVNGNKFVRSYENGQIKEENLTYGNGDKSVCSYENGQLIERWESPKPLGELESSKRKWKSDKGNRRIDTIVDGKTVLEEYTDKKGNKYKEVSRGAGVTTTTEFGVGEKPKTQITKFANGTVMTKEFGSKTNKIIVKESDGRETVRFEDKDGKLLPEDCTAEIKEQPSVASESKNEKVEAKKSKKSLGNGIGVDDKLLAMQQAEAHKSLGNGKGLDDKLLAMQQAKERVAKVARAKGKGKIA